MNEYKTLRAGAETEYVVQKSRFVAFAAPVAAGDEAIALLGTIKKRHRNASHNCYAYVIGQNKGVIRYSDDGEPSGTAGKPMVEVMMTKELTDCAVVVTRYFGGVLLGAGGLLRAYTHAASIALEAAGICSMHETARWQLAIAYPYWDRIAHALKTLPVIAENIAYTDTVSLSLLTRTADADDVMHTLLQITDGRIRTTKEEKQFYYPWGI